VRRETEATVLIVEDELALAETYAAFLEDDYDVEVAAGGEEAFCALDETVDVVLLDRQMPVVSGREVLAYIEEEGIECRVALVTAATPDFDIIDFRIDDYLVKPLTAAELAQTVERLLALEEYDERTRELSSKRLKRNVLEVEKPPNELAESDEFARLNREIEALETEVEAISDELGIDELNGRR